MIGRGGAPFVDHVIDALGDLDDVMEALLPCPPEVIDLPFEVFEKRMAPLGKAPSVTIQKRGLFSINRAAHALLAEPETVELLYDREARIVGLRPVDPAVPHAYIMRPQSSNRDTGPLIVAGTAFTQYYNIDTTVSRRWVPELRDGILCIDLDGPSVEIVGNRSISKEDRDHGSDSN